MIDDASCKANTDAIRESFGRVVYSHKTHEKAREIQARRSTIAKWVNIVLTTSTSVSIVTILVTDVRALAVISAILSAISLAFAISQLSFNPAKDAEQHRAAARELWYIRERYVSLLVDLAKPNANLDSAEIESRRDHLLKDLKAVYDSAPDTTPGAYRAAHKALNVNEEMTFSNEELDAFLPNAIRSSGASINAR